MWLGLLDRIGETADPFREFLNARNADGKIVLSRTDVRNIFALDYSQGVIASIIWAHERGIRVNALSLIVRDLPKLVDLMSVNDFGIQQLQELVEQPGISVPTASKMLSACGIRYRNMTTAIIDDNIIRAIETPELEDDFRHVRTMQSKMRSRPISYFEAYLKDVVSICLRYDLRPDMLDLYLSGSFQDFTAPSAHIKPAAG